MDVAYYVVHTFTDTLFRGNPAGVCLPRAPLPEELMQAIAAENQLPETAFVVPDGETYDIRWFTPTVEMDLCGHATLASTFVLHQFTTPTRQDYYFHSQSGPLAAQVQPEGLYALDFPAWPPAPLDVAPAMEAALGCPVLEAAQSRDLLLRVENEARVRELRPQMAALEQLHGSVIVTAQGDGADFVSRFFAPGFGIAEDPVTGSSHSTLIPFWAARLGKQRMHARQLSPRGGVLQCESRGERVMIAGQARLYLQGKIHV